MPSRRVERLNEQVRSDVSELIARELKDPRLSGLVTVTSAELSPDLGYARLFISVLGSVEDRKHSLEALKSASGFLRRELAARLTIKRAPELHFVLDDSIERGERIIHLLHDIEDGEATGDAGR